MSENLPAPAWFCPAAILEQVLSGKRTEDIAKALGVTRERLSYYLVSKAPDDWKAAQLVRDLRRKEEAEDEIDNAQDHMELRKAESKLKSAQWSLERVCSRIYGDVKEEEPQNRVMISINIARPPEPSSHEKVIEAEPATPLPAPKPTQDAPQKPKPFAAEPVKPLQYPPSNQYV